MNCNVSHCPNPPPTLLVSIPNRDFDELQSADAGTSSVAGNVSIPNRDFDELQCNLAKIYQKEYAKSFNP